MENGLTGAEQVLRRDGRDDGNETENEDNENNDEEEEEEEGEGPFVPFQCPGTKNLLVPSSGFFLFLHLQHFFVFCL